MGGFILEKGCCGCMPLKTCCIVQGVLTIIESFLHFAFLASIFILKDELVEGKTSEERDQIAMGAAILTITAPLALFALINACMLIHGARTDSVKLLKIYLICTVIVWVLDFIVRCALWKKKVVSLGVMIFIFVLRVVQIYFFMHAYSLYKHLKGASYTAAATHT